MNLQNLTNSENCIDSPSTDVDEQQKEQIVDDKTRYKYISTKGKNIGKVCGSILAVNHIMK